MEIKKTYMPKVRTDLTVKRDGTIRISPALVKKLRAKVGDALELVHIGVEVMLTVFNKSDGAPLCGTLRRTAKTGDTLQLNSCGFADAVLEDSEIIGKYRSGEPTVINDRILVPIITRRNYANQANITNRNK